MRSLTLRVVGGVPGGQTHGSSQAVHVQGVVALQLATLLDGSKSLVTLPGSCSLCLLVDLCKERLHSNQSTEIPIRFKNIPSLQHSGDSVAIEVRWVLGPPTIHNAVIDGCCNSFPPRVNHTAGKVTHERFCGNHNSFEGETSTWASSFCLSKKG